MRITSRKRKSAFIEASLVEARKLAIGHLIAGAIVTATPRNVIRKWLREEAISHHTVALWRLTGIRGMALGVGGLMACKNGTLATQQWLRIVALADAGEAYLRILDRAYMPHMKLLDAVSSAIVVWRQLVLAEKLSE